MVPAMVICVPTGPTAGEIPVIPGVTLRFTLLLCDPSTVTTTAAFPKLKPAGTTATIVPSLQLVTVVIWPPMVRVLARWAALKLEPLIVITPPTGACVGDTELIAGGGFTTSVTPELCVMPRPVPLIVSRAEPRLAVGVALKVRMEVPLPASVTGLKEPVTPFGRPETLRVMASLKLFNEVAVTV